MPPLLVDECRLKRWIDSLREQGLDVAAIWELACSADDQDVLSKTCSGLRLIRSEFSSLTTRISVNRL
jgi:hypothetical protein